MIGSIKPHSAHYWIHSDFQMSKASLFGQVNVTYPHKRLHFIGRRLQDMLTEEGIPERVADL